MNTWRAGVVKSGEKQVFVSSTEWHLVRGERVAIISPLVFSQHRVRVEAHAL